MDREKASDRDKAEAFSKLVPSLIGQPTERILDLIQKLEMTVGRIDKDLFAERTRLSTISTVTRPLSTKWLERWNSQGRPDFSFEIASRHASDLLNEDIQTTDALRVWLGKVYEMFTFQVVYRGPLKSLQRVPGSRPGGMVAESNERVYRRNWFSFVDQHLDELMRKANQLSNGDSQSAYSSSYSSAFLESRRKFKRSPRDEHISYSPATTQFEKTYEDSPSGEIYIVTLKSSSGENVASRTWFDLSKLESSLSTWVTATAEVWASDGKTISAAISLTNDSGNSNAKIPVNSPPEIFQATLKYVKSAN
jgi:hypothetical protein